MKYDFLIVGGGIAGLSTAIALQQEGFHVKVLERTRELKEVGAGLGLGANAWKGLELLGITDALKDKCNPIKSTKFLNHKGKLISEVQLERLNEKYGVAYFTVHRAELQKTLVDHLHPGTLELGKTITNVKQDSAGVMVNLEDGSTLEAEALIGADGIHSIIRKTCLPDITPRYSGYTCWRAVVEVREKEFSIGEFTETWGRTGRFGLVPLTENRVYWFACVNAPFQSEEMSKFTVNDLYHIFQDYHSPIPEMVKATRDEDLIWNDIVDLKPIGRFTFNRILLIGDAAHATTPNMGQGAAQAIEDSVMLRKALKKYRQVEKAFLAFEKLRLPKTKKITNMSWRIGKAAQLENRFLIKSRNALMGMLPSKVFEKQFESIFRTDY